MLEALKFLAMFSSPRRGWWGLDVHLCRRDVLQLGGGRLIVSPRGSHSALQVLLFSSQVQVKL